MVESFAISAVLILLGWSLGFLSTYISDKRKHSRNKIIYMRAYIADLKLLRARLVLSCYRLTQQFGLFDRAFLAWYFEVIESLSDVEVVLDKELLLKIKDLPEEELSVYIENSKMKSFDKGWSVKKLLAPFLISNLHAIQWFNSKTSMSLLDIVSRIHMINEQIDESRQGFLMTFQDDLTDTDRHTVHQNLNNNYKQLGMQMRLLVDKTSVVIEQHGYV